MILYMGFPNEGGEERGGRAGLSRSYWERIEGGGGGACHDIYTGARSLDLSSYRVPSSLFWLSVCVVCCMLYVCPPPPAPRPVCICALLLASTSIEPDRLVRGLIHNVRSGGDKQTNRRTWKKKT